MTMSMSRIKWIGLSVCFILFLLYVLLNLSHTQTFLNRGVQVQAAESYGKRTPGGKVTTLAPLQVDTVGKKCPDVLQYMTQGEWRRRHVSTKDQVEMKVFLDKARMQHFLPPSLQRPDGKCGNVTFDKLKKGFHNLLWFRALCDMNGPRACCYQGVCTDRKISECSCADCYDMRQAINAEHADWVTRDNSCSISSKNESTDEMCHILRKMHITFIGDSFVRHIFLAFQLLLSNDLNTGAMKPGLVKSLRDTCAGLYMFTEKECRGVINSNPLVCNGDTVLQFFEYNSLSQSPQIQQVISAHSKRNGTMVILGLGIHDNYDAPSTWSRLLYPVASYPAALSRGWPRLVWCSPHAPGLLKTPRVPEQSYDSVRKFNSQIREYLSHWNVPIFDTFNLTDGVNSFDGAHYGLGVNVLKSKILIKYIQELRTKEMW